MSFILLLNCNTFMFIKMGYFILPITNNMKKYFMKTIISSSKFMEGSCSQKYFLLTNKQNVLK